VSKMNLLNSDVKISTSFVVEIGCFIGICYGKIQKLYK
jgi:hypothetical protein